MTPAAGRAPLRPSASVPRTADTRCCTNSYVSSRQSCVTRTLSGRQTRDRSLRSRSTIITFSARSFSLCSSSSPANRSASGRAVRCRVPLIGRASTWPSRTLRNRSGEALTICVVAQIEIAGERRRVAASQPQVQRHRVVVRRIQQPLGEVDLKHVAGVDVLDRPANGGQIGVGREVAGQVRPGPGTANCGAS